MTEDDEFVKADVEAGDSKESAALIVASSRPVEQAISSSDVLSLRKALIERHYEGARGFLDYFRKGGQSGSAEMLAIALLDEVIKESDNLLGNELVATQNGDLRDASIISFKRAEVLEKAIRAVQAKRELEKEGGLDLESPSLIVVFRYFMMKVKEAFDRLGLEAEVSDLFFRTLGDVTSNWKKELREQFRELKEMPNGQ